MTDREISIMQEQHKMRVAALVKEVYSVRKLMEVESKVARDAIQQLQDLQRNVRDSHERERVVNEYETYLKDIRNSTRKTDLPYWRLATEVLELKEFFEAHSDSGSTNFKEFVNRLNEYLKGWMPGDPSLSYQQRVFTALGNFTRAHDEIRRKCIEQQNIISKVTKVITITPIDHT